MGKGKGVFVKNAPERYSPLVMIAADGSTSSYHGGSSTRHTVRVLMTIEKRLLRREKPSRRPEKLQQRRTRMPTPHTHTTTTTNTSISTEYQYQYRIVASSAN